VICVEEIELSEQLDEDSFIVFCNECGFRQDHTPKYSCGDPRNIALIGHWDGWQPFGASGRHSCGIIKKLMKQMMSVQFTLQSPIED